MSLITNDKKQLSTINTEDTYKEIRCFIISAKQEIYKSVNSAMVEAYWNIGKKIYEVCGENDRAEYGKQVLKNISLSFNKKEIITFPGYDFSFVFLCISSYCLYS